MTTAGASAWRPDDGGGRRPSAYVCPCSITTGACASVENTTPLRNAFRHVPSRHPQAPFPEDGPARWSGSPSRPPRSRRGRIRRSTQADRLSGTGLDGSGAGHAATPSLARMGERKRISPPPNRNAAAVGSAMSVSITPTLSASRMASRLRRSPVVRVSSGTLARRRSKKPGTFSGSGCAIIRSTHLRNRTARMRWGRVLQYPVRIIHVQRGRGLIILLPSVASI